MIPMPFRPYVLFLLVMGSLFLVSCGSFLINPTPEPLKTTDGRSIPSKDAPAASTPEAASPSIGRATLNPASKPPESFPAPSVSNSKPLPSLPAVRESGKDSSWQLNNILDGDLTDPSEADTDYSETYYDVPIVINDSVEAYIEYFNTAIRDRFTLWLERSGRYIPVMRQIFKEHGLPEDLVFVALIESGFNPYAYSRARASGPWQFIQGTGRIYGLRVDSWVDERRDPIKSTRAAARHLRDLHNRFNSWPLAMAAYNAGERKIERALAKANTADFWDLRPTRYIRQETKGYVPKFMAATIIAKNPERYGFTLDYHEPLKFSTVTVPGSADMRIIAETVGISYAEIKELNPELRTVLTPPYVEAYPVRLPFGADEGFEEAYAQIPEDRKVIALQYTVRRNDTLSKIAKQFGTTVELIRELNHLPQKRTLRIGESLFIPKMTESPSKMSVQSASAARESVETSPQSRLKESPVETPVEEGEKIFYLVKDGDTLWTISQNFKVSIRDIKKYNGLTRNLIRPGDQLVLGYESKDL